jgi:hypothetical protein
MGLSQHQQTAWRRWWLMAPSIQDSPPAPLDSIEEEGWGNGRGEEALGWRGEGWAEEEKCGGAEGGGKGTPPEGARPFPQKLW